MIVSVSGTEISATHIHTKELLWQKFLGKPIKAPVLLDSDFLVVSVITDDALYVFDFFTGEEIWSRDQTTFNSKVPGSPVFSESNNGLITATEPIPGANTGTVFAFAAIDGQRKWTRTMLSGQSIAENVIESLPAKNDRLYFINQGRSHSRLTERKHNFDRYGIHAGIFIRKLQSAMFSPVVQNQVAKNLKIVYFVHYFLSE
ncbi:MAG: PQQ-binding-like beta-propeller repeat protein, partial [bacterium]